MCHFGLPVSQAMGMSSIGYHHSQLSSFGTSIFFKKNVCTHTGIFLFVIFTAPVPACRSCCYILVTSPSLYWVLVLVCHRSIEGKLLNEILICGKCQKMSSTGREWLIQSHLSARFCFELSGYSN